MHQHDVLRAWVAGITKTGTEQEQVDRLADVLDGLLSYPAARALAGYRSYDRVRQQARDSRPHGPGVATLADVLIDLSGQLQRPKSRGGRPRRESPCDI